MKMRSYLTEIEEIAVCGWVTQPELCRLTGLDVRTIRTLRKQGLIDTDVVAQNEIWLSLESIKQYCNRERRPAAVGA